MPLHSLDIPYRHCEEAEVKEVISLSFAPRLIYSQDVEVIMSKDGGMVRTGAIFLGVGELR
ncbi:hypothetical protein [Nostoc sp. FACHB-133]|uniref:hypothetical protein n=1 Tax=Nostoc sp. FACHB-133 TaxID=2692835 RepID=UPI0016821A06|nr:hypothetical protein [Nostoc sp. FACHB-133]MBD2521046.1 hypothetical protein [Nostoc sp. FACHB-133]